MATFIDLDSIWRDREVNPNPAEYELRPQQVETWFRGARSVRAHPQNPNLQPLEFATTVNIRYLTVPYTEFLAGIPRLYVDLHTVKYNDIHLIQTIDGRHPTARFICAFDKIQNDAGGEPLWIHYACRMEQTMRFKRDDPVVFRVMTRDGSVLPNTDTLVPEDPDPNKQILATFEITPYIRDGDYENSLVETSVL